jgi:hypothetical protein
MRRRKATSVLAVAVAAFLCALPATAATPVSVDPAIGTPDTAFHVEVPALYAIRRSRDAYWFVMHGPGGANCEASVTDRVGVTPPRGAKTVFVDLPGVLIVNRREVVPGPWCVGSFNGHVEFRRWSPRRHLFVVHRMGDFSVQVAQSQ